MDPMPIGSNGPCLAIEDTEEEAHVISGCP